MNFLAKQVILPYGNYAMPAGGTPLFSLTKPKPGRRMQLIGTPGQPVAYTYPAAGGVPVTVATADIPALKTDVYFGIFADPFNDGYATEVQLIAGEKISSCLLDTIDTVTPLCGGPSIKAVTIDCVDCLESYTARVALRDFNTLSYNTAVDKPEEFFVTHHTQCNSCTDCSQEANCKDIVNGLVDQINGTDELLIGDRLYPDYVKPNTLPRVRAVVGHANWFTYCITPEAADCVDCYQVDAITTATVNGVALNFVRNLDPQDSDFTLLGQIEDIAYQIEDAFTTRIGKHSGFAVVTRGVNNCCPLQLHVITCDEDFAITGLTPCDLSFNMEFSPATAFADCVTPAAANYIPDCWFAVIAAPNQPPCENCDLSGPMPWYGVDVDVDILKDASAYGPIVKKKTILESVSPRNFGMEIRYLQYHYGFPGGRGRNWNTSNPTSGFLGIPDSTSRFKNAVTAKCGSQYCTVDIKYHSVYKTEDLPSPEYIDFETIWALDTKDTVTIASVVPFFNALATKSGGSCKVLGPIACS